MSKIEPFKEMLEQSQEILQEEISFARIRFEALKKKIEAEFDTANIILVDSEELTDTDLKLFSDYEESLYRIYRMISRIKKEGNIDLEKDEIKDILKDTTHHAKTIGQIMTAIKENKSRNNFYEWLLNRITPISNLLQLLDNDKAQEDDINKALNSLNKFVVGRLKRLGLSAREQQDIKVVCAMCNKVRVKKGETPVINENISHGYCPSCIEQKYGKSQADIADDERRKERMLDEEWVDDIEVVDLETE